MGITEQKGVVIRLSGDSNDEIQLIVYDDLTDLNGFQAVVQGHVVED